MAREAFVVDIRPANIRVLSTVGHGPGNHLERAVRQLTVRRGMTGTDGVFENPYNAVDYVATKVGLAGIDPKQNTTLLNYLHEDLPFGDPLIQTASWVADQWEATQSEVVHPNNKIGVEARVLVTLVYEKKLGERKRTGLSDPRLSELSAYDIHDLAANNKEHIQNHTLAIKLAEGDRPHFNVDNSVHKPLFVSPTKQEPLTF